MTAPLLDVRDLSVEFPLRRQRLQALDGISFSLEAGEVLGFVGESGAGKSLTGAAIMGLLEPPGRITAGIIALQGRRIEDDAASVRGGEIGMIFQDPLTSLNPLRTVGDQLVETIQLHLDLSGDAAEARAIQLLEEVGIDPERRSAFPHEFSGGMRQRIVIALALAPEPKLIIADEPTTALDVSIQAQVLALLRQLCKERGAAVILITHDMGVIAETTDRVAVLYAGRLVEDGPTADVIAAPQHPYTAGLMASTPNLDAVSVDTVLPQIPGNMPGLMEFPSAQDRFAAAMQRLRVRRSRCSPVLESHALNLSKPLHRSKKQQDEPESYLNVTNISRHFDISDPILARMLSGGGKRILTAVDDVSFSIAKGQTYALVGESGSGKSTIARMVVGLERPDSGRILIDGQTAFDAAGGHSQDERLRQKLQMVFQSPYSSLNPRWRVGDILMEPIKAFSLIGERSAQQRRVDELLEQVGLSSPDAARFPHEFSGGQRQRISIARALASNPQFIVCDEPTSALDVSVQAQVLNLLKQLQRDLQLTYLFISHDMAVVRVMAHRIGVLKDGRLVEENEASKLIESPQQPYTRMLMESTPRFAGGVG